MCMNANFNCVDVKSYKMTDLASEPHLKSGLNSVTSTVPDISSQQEKGKSSRYSMSDIVATIYYKII